MSFNLRLWIYCSACGEIQLAGSELTTLNLTVKNIKISYTVCIKCLASVVTESKSAELVLGSDTDGYFIKLDNSSKMVEIETTEDKHIIDGEKLAEVINIFDKKAKI